MSAVLDRSFERFEGRPIIAGEEVLHVTLDKRGMLNMNAFCYRELGKPTAVYLHFSRKEETIAIEPVHSFKRPNAFPFRPNGTGRYINTAPFCRHYGIKVDETQKFVRAEVRDGVLFLKLAETVSVTRRRKKSSTHQ